MVAITFTDIDLSPFKAVLLDLDDTLYAYEPCHQAALQACYGLYEGEMNDKEFAQCYRQHRNQVMEQLQPQGACRSRLLAFQLMFETCKIQQAYQIAKQFDDCYWQTFLQYMQADAKAYNFLVDCKKRGLATCVISDMLTIVQIQKIEQLGLTEYIDYLVTSEEIGLEKPASAMFQAALEKLQCTPEEVVMLGDSQEKDIHGALTQGIQAYRVSL